MEESIEYLDLSLHDLGERCTLVELAEFSGLPTAEILDLIDYGCIEPIDVEAAEWRFSSESVALINSAARLRRDLELEVYSVAVIVSLLARIRELEAQVRALRVGVPGA